MFRALLTEKNDSGYQTTLQSLSEDQLPDGDVQVQVDYSTINYKDALAITGSAPVVRQFPMVPGIDLAGTVVKSANSSLSIGDKVVLNGWGVGETHWGGLSQQARLQADWLVPLPSKFSPRQAMAIGTAGYTAMLCIMALEQHGVTPEQGEILVTGAAGGVGSVAIAILAKLGFTVVALSGRPQEQDYLLSLGAASVIERQTMSEPGRPLGKERWAGVVDVAGSHILANACATTQYGGVVTACGLAAGMDLPASVAPFILRGVTLAGIDSVMCPKPKRIEAWKRLATDLDIEKLTAITTEIGLADCIDTASALLQGQVRGRLVVNVNA